MVGAGRGLRENRKRSGGESDAEKRDWHAHKISGKGKHCDAADGQR